MNIMTSITDHLRPEPFALSPHETRNQLQRMPRRAGIPGLIALLCAAAACDGPSSPSPVASMDTPTPSLAATVQARIDGQVMDADHEGPVPGAVVTICGVTSDGRSRTLAQSGPSVTTDDNGDLFLTASLPERWTEVRLNVARDEYVPARRAGSAAVAPASRWPRRRS